MAKVKPPANFRFRFPRVCATCKYFQMGDGSSECLRPDGPDFDNGDMHFWVKVCDRFVHETDEARVTRVMNLF